MSESHHSLRAFLSSAKDALHSSIEKTEKVTLVMGGDTADIDSIASSTLYAFVRSADPPKDAFSHPYVPLLQSGSDELAQRSEVARLLHVCHLKPKELVTLESLLKKGSVKSGLVSTHTKIFLTNHNILLGRMDQDLRERIAGCIDNHKDENYVPQNTAPEPRIIGHSSSCTSLVVNTVASSWSSLKSHDSGTPHLEKLALGAILLTSNNLSDNRCTEEDSRAVHFLESRIRSAHDGDRFDRDAFYRGLVGEEHHTREVPVAVAAPVVVAPVAASVAYVDEPRTVSNSAPTYGAVPLVASAPRDVYTSDATDLPVLLSQNFKDWSASSGAGLGLSLTTASISQLVDQSERDIAHRAILGLAEEPTLTLHKGSPFTRAVRHFTEKKGLGVYGILTEAGELFVWQVAGAKLGVDAIGRFMTEYGKALELGPWGTELDEISREAGEYSGLMKVFVVGAGGVTRDVVAGMLGQCMA